MGIFDSTVEVPRRTMVLFFLIDTSGSMAGSKIGTVNSAIEEVIPELKDLSENNADAQIKIAALAFSTGARWIEGAPVSSENYRWNYLNASGVTDFGEACRQLNSKLSRTEFMSDATGSFAPAIFCFPMESRRMITEADWRFFRIISGFKRRYGWQSLSGKMQIRVFWRNLLEAWRLSLQHAGRRNLGNGSALSA